MIQPASSKPKSGKRGPRASKKPRLTDPAPELVDDVFKLVETIACPPVEETETRVDLPVEESKGEELSEAPLVEKTLCPCGSVIATKSLAKHEKTKKHTAWLAAQEITVVI